VATRLIYQGPSAGATLLAGLLEAEGLEVSYRPAMETRSAESQMAQVAISVSEGAGGTALAGGIAEAVRRLRNRKPARAQLSMRVESDEIPPEELDI
jgi:hypothetical protein